MKKNIFLFGLFIPLLTTGQLPDYYVDLVKGSVTVEGADKKVKALKQFAFLFKDDIITIKNSGDEVTIANRKYQFTTLHVPGSFRVGDLDEKLLKKSHGVMEKYLHLVWEELLHPGKDYSSFKAKNLGTWGGVTRGLCTTVEYPYLNMILCTDTLSFIWKPDEEGITYELLVKDTRGSGIKLMLLKDTIATVPVHGWLKGSARSFSWSVQNPNDPCTPLPEYKFTLMTREAYNAKVIEISNSITGKDNKHRLYLDIAETMEKQGFYDAAAEYIVKAMMETKEIVKTGL